MGPGSPARFRALLPGCLLILAGCTGPGRAPADLSGTYDCAAFGDVAVRYDSEAPDRAAVRLTFDGGSRELPGTRPSRA